VIPANKDIYSADGSLLATSIPTYEIRFDAVAPKQTFEKNVKSLSDSLATVLGKSSNFFENELRKARANKTDII
jgi:cell division protein FtsI (penicillin-binding protein 3)